MIYLDHHAATPLASHAVRAMDAARPFAWANPSSVHAAGRKARASLESARDAVAAAVGTMPSGVVFTAGGSESCQTGIIGLSEGMRRIVTTQLEHPAVSESVAALAARGIEVVRVVLRHDVAPSAADFATHIDANTLVAVQWVNHETGLILPVESLALTARSVGARMFVDATQALGRIPINCDSLGASAIAVASHKIGGPSGAGALVLGRGVVFDSLLLGGGQERGRRAGSPAVEAIIGFGGACSAIAQRLEAMPRLAELRDLLEYHLHSLGAELLAVGLPRVASCASIAFRGRRGAVLVAALDLEGICVSSGPACSSGVDSPSPSVLALTSGDVARAAGTLRFSLGPESTKDDVLGAVEALRRVLERRLPNEI